VALIPAQLFIVDRQPALTELLGAVAGAACFARWRNPDRRVSAWAFLGVLVVRGLVPFEFLPNSGPFSWIPFGGFLEMNWQTGVQVLAEKFFWYGTAIWLLHRARLARGVATGLVTAALLSIEILQTHLPGRVAEITDPLLAVCAGLALAAMGWGRGRVSRLP
jgi:hypothetical protein